MIYRVYARGVNGEIRSSDYGTLETLLSFHTKIGIDDCSINLSLRGEPIILGLIGPMSDSTDVVRYETPEVFEKLTREWGRPRRRRRVGNS